MTEQAIASVSREAAEAVVFTTALWAGRTTSGGAQAGAVVMLSPAQATESRGTSNKLAATVAAELEAPVGDFEDGGEIVRRLAAAAQ